MSFVGSGTTGTEQAQKFLESLQNDFRQLSAETKKKNPQIKEVKEKNIPLKIQQMSSVHVISRKPQHETLHFWELLM